MLRCVAIDPRIQKGMLKLRWARSILLISSQADFHQLEETFVIASWHRSEQMMNSLHPLWTNMWKVCVWRVDLQTPSQPALAVNPVNLPCQIDEWREEHPQLQSQLSLDWDSKLDQTGQFCPIFCDMTSRNHDCCPRSEWIIWNQHVFSAQSITIGNKRTRSEEQSDSHGYVKIIKSIQIQRKVDSFKAFDPQHHRHLPRNSPLFRLSLQAGWDENHWRSVLQLIRSHLAYLAYLICACSERVSSMTRKEYDL